MVAQAEAGDGITRLLCTPTKNERQWWSMINDACHPFCSGVFMSGEEEGKELKKHWHWHTGKIFGGTQRETQELKQKATTLLLKSDN